MTNKLKVLVKLSNGGIVKPVEKKDMIATAWKLANTVNMMNSMLRVKLNEESNFIVTTNPNFGDFKVDKSKEEVLEMFKFYFDAPKRQATNQYIILSLAHAWLKGSLIESICDYVMQEHKLNIEDFYSEDVKNFIESKSNIFIYVLNMDLTNGPTELSRDKEYECYITPTLVEEYFNATGDMAALEKINTKVTENVEIKDLIKLHLNDLALDQDTRQSTSFKSQCMCEITRILNGDLTYSCGFFSLPDGSNKISKETYDDVCANLDNYALIQYDVEQVQL